MFDQSVNLTADAFLKRSYCIFFPKPYDFTSTSTLTVSKSAVVQQSPPSITGTSYGTLNSSNVREAHSHAIGKSHTPSAEGRLCRPSSPDKPDGLGASAFTGTSTCTCNITDDLGWRHRTNRN